MQPTPSPAPAPATPGAPDIPSIPPIPPIPPVPSIPPTPGVPSVVLPNGEVLLGGLPRSAEELDGLRARREILRDQLERATNRRERLVSQLEAAPSSEARAGLQQRLQELDQRIMQIERDQGLTERLISNAPASVLAETQTARRESGSVGEDEMVAASTAAFGAGVLLTILLGRLRRRMAARRGATRTPIAAAEQERYDRLTQAVDAIALEVERIGEGQRFVTQLLSERREAPVLQEPRR